MEHVDRRRDEDAPLDVSGGSGARAAGLLPPGAVVVAGGDGPAGLDAPVPAADPAVMALLQQLLASNHATAARVTCVENQQALSHQQQQQQQQQQGHQQQQLQQQ